MSLEFLMSFKHATVNVITGHTINVLNISITTKASDNYESCNKTEDETKRGQSIEMIRH